MTRAEIERHADPPEPTADDRADERVVRHDVRALAHTIRLYCPAGPDQATAYQLLWATLDAAIRAIRGRPRLDGPGRPPVAEACTE